MIEVLKTNVRERPRANLLIAEIHKAFSDYTVNFDLDDCDRILRVKCNTGSIHISQLICFLEGLGVEAKILPDEIDATGFFEIPSGNKEESDSNLD